MLNKQQILRLKEIAEELALIASSLEKAEGMPTEDVAKRVEEYREKQICLFCGKSLVGANRVIRGVHYNCRRDINNIVAKTGRTLDDFEASGLLGPQSPGGRPEKKIENPLEMLKDSRSHTKEEWAKILIKKNEELSKKTEKPKPKKEPK